MIEFAEEEFMHGLTAQSLKRIAFLFGESIEEVTEQLDPAVVAIDVEHHTIPRL